jgi:hypothetical protein
MPMCVLDHVIIFKISKSIISLQTMRICFHNCHRKDDMNKYSKNRTTWNVEIPQKGTNFIRPYSQLKKNALINKHNERCNVKNIGVSLQQPCTKRT